MASTKRRRSLLSGLLRRQARIQEGTRPGMVLQVGVIVEMIQYLFNLFQVSFGHFGRKRNSHRSEVL